VTPVSGDAGKASTSPGRHRFVTSCCTPDLVIPAKAGMTASGRRAWIPAFAGTTPVSTLGALLPLPVQTRTSTLV
jgi:hypothetical protein